jgi:O-antigen ligase
MVLAMTRWIDQAKLARTADWLAVALAASLPWSTSATSILAALWIVAVIPTLDWRALRETLLTPAGGLPVLLVALGVAGVLWADVTWAERWNGVGSFLKLLVIPLMLIHFQRSARGLCVVAGFLVSCALLLLVSTVVQFTPGLSFNSLHADLVIVKNAATQSGEFVICIFGMLYLAVDCIERRRWLWLSALAVVAFGMLANMLFVATGRTALVMLPILLAVFAIRRLTPRGFAILAAATVAIAVLAWVSSPFLRSRTIQAWTDYQKYEIAGEQNSSGERLEFWTKSIGFVRDAPIFGHGTGSIHALFIASSAGKTGAAGSATTNPHNQTFAVAIQLGLVGAVLLWAMWIAHLLLFRGSGLAEWIGLVVVVQNIVGSAFNSHLFDFVQGWIYVIGVGVAGGMALKNRTPPRPAASGA